MGKKRLWVTTTAFPASIIFTFAAQGVAYADNSILKDPAGYFLVCAKVSDIMDGFARSKGFPEMSKEASTFYDKYIEVAKEEINAQKLTELQATKKVKTAEKYVGLLNGEQVGAQYKMCKIAMDAAPD